MFSFICHILGCNVRCGDALHKRCEEGDVRRSTCDIRMPFFMHSCDDLIFYFSHRSLDNNDRD